MKNRVSVSLFFIITAVEGVWVLISLWEPTPEKGNLSVLGFSPARLVLLVLVSLSIGSLIFLATRVWRSKSETETLVHSIYTHRFLLLIVFSIYIIGISAAYVAIFSPLRLERLYGYFTRWNTLFIWANLFIVQFIGLGIILRGPAYWLSAWRDLLKHPSTQRLFRFTNSPAAGILLLLLSIVIGLTKVYYGRFVDEADNLAVGWLLTKGYTLYQEIFSHHFPFAYYWVALVVRLFGNSFIAVRISVLLLQIGVFAVSMKITRFYLALGLTSMIWNLTNQFVRGQEAIYPTFEGILMLGAFLLIFFLLVKRQKPGKITLVLLGAYLATALLTDPLMVYPILVAFCGLFVSGLVKTPNKGYPEGMRRVLISGTTFIFILGLFGLQLVSQRTLSGFYQETIWFNREIYAKYENADPNRIGQIGRYILTGLDILSPAWYQQPSPFIPLNTYRSIKLEDENLYNEWIFTGFLFRFSILAAVAGLALRRRMWAGGFLYLFSAAMMARADHGYYAIGFSLIGIFAGFYLFAELRRPGILRWMKTHHRQSSAMGQRLSQTTWGALITIIAGMFFWTALRGGYYLADNSWDIINGRHVNMYRNFGEDIRDLACDQPDLEIAVYPINPIVYFITEIPPASRYIFMYPWVAEVGQQELISELGTNPSAVVWINTNRGEGDNAVALYMGDTIRFLNETYVSVGTDFWMSPELAKRCNILPGETQFNRQETDDGE